MACGIQTNVTNSIFSFGTATEQRGLWSICKYWDERITRNSQYPQNLRAHPLEYEIIFEPMKNNGGVTVNDSFSDHICSCSLNDLSFDRGGPSLEGPWRTVSSGVQAAVL